MNLLYLPTTPEELTLLGWTQLDIILVTGDSYIDSPFIGAAVIGRWLAQAGYKVGIIAQPDYQSGKDITRLGEPRLFWGITGGSVDSMVANYTASGRPRQQDDYTPGGVNNRRPDRAVIVYANLIRRFFKSTVPLVLGGIEASLRRVAHYDYWENKIRRSILLDAKGDYLIYGMAETAILEFANAFANQRSATSVLGLCYLTQTPPAEFSELPSYEAVTHDPDQFAQMFKQFYLGTTTGKPQGMKQKHGERWLVHNPPAPVITSVLLDQSAELDYTHDPHPYYAKQGVHKALETIRFAIRTHRGCYGACGFCSIALHEGRTVTSRSEASILREATRLTEHPAFKGYLHDLGGPTANMYGYECARKITHGPCAHKQCIFPEICKELRPNHQRQVKLLQQVRKIPKVKKVFVASGIRYDLIRVDIKHGELYLQELVAHHVSGQLKVAPEHSEPKILKLMGKPDTADLLWFKERFDTLSKQYRKKQFLTYYFIASYPGCTDQDMRNLRQFVVQQLHLQPEQVQQFTPLPSTYGALMYHTQRNPYNGEKLFVEKDRVKSAKQKDIVQR